MYVTYTCIHVRLKHYICNDMHEDICGSMCMCVYPQRSLSCWQRVALSVWQVVLNCSGYCWLPAWHPFVSYHLPFQNTPLILSQCTLSVYES